MTPCPRSASRSLPWRLSWMSGGKVSTRTWSPFSYRPSGSSGCTSASSLWSIGPTRCLAPVAADGKPRDRRPWQRCARHLSSTPSLSSWPRPSLRSGTHGRTTGSKPFSALRRPLKGATACCRRCITISGACPNSVTRCGRCCIISIVVLWMGRRQRCVFSDRRFRISLRRCYPISMSCLGRDNDKPR